MNKAVEMLSSVCRNLCMFFEYVAAAGLAQVRRSDAGVES